MRVIRALGICLTCCLPGSPLPVNRKQRGKKKDKEKREMFRRRDAGRSFCILSYRLFSKQLPTSPFGSPKFQTNIFLSPV